MHVVLPEIGKQRYVEAALILSAWTAYGVFFASQGFLRQKFSGGAVDLSRFLVPWLICAYCWALLTPFVFTIAYRFPFAKNGFSKFLAVHGLAAIALSLVQLALYLVVFTLLFGAGRGTFSENYQRLFLESFHQSVLVYFLIIAVYSARGFLSKPIRLEDPGSIRNDSLDELDKNSEESVELASLRANVSNGHRTLVDPVYLSRISIKTNGRIVLLDVKDIDWIASEGNYVKLHTTNKTSLLRETMKAMEQKLDPSSFLRVRRSAIVRIERIQELHPLFNGEFEIVLKDGTKITSSRRYRKNLESLLRY